MDKRIFLVLIAFSMVLGCAFASTITRSVDSATVAPGADVKVTLTVDITGGETFYVIDEIFPSGWTVKDAGTGSTGQAGHLKWVVIQDAKNTTYDYVLTVPATVGTETFSGTYMFEGMASEAQIQGIQGIEFVTPSVIPPAETNMDFPMVIIAAIVMIIVIAVVAISMKKKK